MKNKNETVIAKKKILKDMYSQSMYFFCIFAYHSFLHFILHIIIHNILHFIAFFYIKKSK